MDDRYVSAAAVVRDVIVEFAEEQLRHHYYEFPFDGMSEEALLDIFRERCDLYKHKYDRSECIDVIKSFVSDGTLVADDTEGITLFRFSVDGSDLERWMKNARTMASDQGLINCVIDHGGIEHICRDLQRNLRLINLVVDRGGIEQVCKDLKRIELSLRRRVDLPCYMGKRYQDYFRSFLGRGWQGARRSGHASQDKETKVSSEDACAVSTIPVTRRSGTDDDLGTTCKSKKRKRALHNSTKKRKCLQ